MKNHTIKDIVDFVLKNKRNLGFKNFTTPEDVYHEVRLAMDRNCFAYCTDDITGKIIGVVTGETAPLYKIFFLRNILTTQRGVVSIFVDKFCSMYPGYNIES